MSKDENENGVNAAAMCRPGQVRGLHAILCDYVD